MIAIDFETKSYADLPKVGAWAYSEHPTTDIICVCYGIDYEPIQTWWPGKNEEDLMPSDLYEAVAHGDTVEAHNVAFERSIWENVLVKKYGWILPHDDQWRDSMAVCQYKGLPAALGKVSKVLGYEGKDPEGGRLISKYSKLNLKTAKTEIPDEDFKKFVAYCVKDVELEQAISDELEPLPPQELAVFILDQRINMRGLCLDLEGIKTATTIVEQRAEELTKNHIKITGLSPTQTPKLIEWYAGQGITLDNMQADYLGELLDGDTIPQGRARVALHIRLAINKASTKKLNAMARQAGMDGRARFQSRYHGAVTGRWTGSGFQPLNLTRGFEGMDPEQLVRDIAYGDASYLDAVYGDAMDAVSKASRYWITARSGHKIIAGDFVSIEAIILACLSNEQWKIDAFRNGVKIYEYMADKIYGLASGTVTKSTHPTERQDGKTGELAFGYQGALGAWLKFDNSGRHTDERIIDICKAWRAEHPNVVSFWQQLQTAAIRAVKSRGVTEAGAYIKFEVVKDWLTMILPSGKKLWYYSPQVKSVRPRWCKPETEEKCRNGTCSHSYVPQLTYMAQKEGQWRVTSTYGGKLAENACQAVSREILVPAMHRIDPLYPIILTVYDEIVTEVPEDFGSIEEFCKLMEGPLPEWASDWPISADGWEGKRYRK